MSRKPAPDAPKRTPPVTPPVKPHGPLVIVDDYLPNILSGFRVAEINAYIEAFPDVRVRSTLPPEQYERHIAIYRRHFPHYARCFAPFDPKEDFGPDALVFAYFLNTATFILPLCEARNLPLGFQLCPGGGFALNEEPSDRRLARVARSPMLSFVVTTQPITQRYLLDRYPELASRTQMISPGPVWGEEMAAVYAQRGARRAKRSGVTFAFVAARYADNVSNKGYDFFCAMADVIAEAMPDAHFHVVGDWRAEDAPLGRAHERTSFHGMLPNQRLRELYRDIDFVISPNIPYSLSPGNFDGFPTASNSEAALAGAIVVASDPLSLNTRFKADRDFILIERAIDRIDPDDVSAAAERVLAVANDPERMAKFSEASRRAFARHLSPAEQLTPRVAIMRRALQRELEPRHDDLKLWREAIRRQAEETALQRGKAERHWELINKANEYAQSKEARLTELVAEIDARDARIAELDAVISGRVEESGAGLKTLAQNLEEANAYGKSRDDAVADLIEQIAARDLRIAELAGTLEVANTYGRSRDEAVALFTAELAARDATIKEIAGHLDVANAYGKSRDDTVAQLVADLAALDARASEFASHLEEANAYGKQRDDAVSELLRQLSARDQKLSESYAAMEARIAQSAGTEGVVAARKERLKQLEEFLNLAESAQMRLTSELSAARERSTTLEQQNATLTDTAVELTAENKALRDGNNVRTARITELENELAERTNRLETVSARAEEVEAVNAVLVAAREDTHRSFHDDLMQLEHALQVTRQHTVTVRAEALAMLEDISAVEEDLIARQRSRTSERSVKKSPSENLSAWLSPNTHLALADLERDVLVVRAALDILKPRLMQIAGAEARDDDTTERPC